MFDLLGDRPDHGDGTGGDAHGLQGCVGAPLRKSGDPIRDRSVPEFVFIVSPMFILWGYYKKSL